MCNASIEVSFTYPELPFMYICTEHNDDDLRAQWKKGISNILVKIEFEIVPSMHFHKQFQTLRATHS